MKKMTIIILLSLLLGNCSKNEDYIKMSIVETGCMNAWDDFYTGSNDYKDAVKKYLKSENINIYVVSSEVYDHGPQCMACSCPTGRFIIIEIAPSDLSKAEDLGFMIFNSNVRIN